MNVALVVAGLSLMLQPTTYQLIDQGSVEAAWDGAPRVLLENQNAAMPQTPNGTMIFAYWNQSEQNNAGSIAITSGGAAPVFKNVPALANQPSVWMYNWKSNNLSVTNISPNAQTPIQIQAIGPGIPGTTPLALPVGATGQRLGYGQTAQGSALPQYMQLLVQSDSATTGIIGLIGGPPDAEGENGYVIAVNYATNSGPGTGAAPPEGYYATTTSNSYTFQFNWGSSVVFVANLSSLNAAPLKIVLRAL
ncbi:MAG: hypothetical protein B7Y45_02870 [Sphingomonas sp. 28-66-16]|nr:MAG: hypothetical protein B7Y45_02870 [Sphingomonas sp. 28-66-16]